MTTAQNKPENTEEQNANRNVAQLNTPDASNSKGYWGDAWSRLTKNRLAIIGLVLIIINMILAIFAPAFAVEGVDDQNTEEANAAPEWVINLFPILSARDEVFNAADGEIIIETGEQVEEGELLVDFSIGNLQAPVSGTAFLDVRRFYLIPDSVEIANYTVPAGPRPAVSHLDSVEAGDTLFGDQTAPYDGTVHIVGDQIWLQPTTVWRRSAGEVVVENLQEVSAGDVLLTTEEGDEITTAFGGTVFITRNNVELALIEPARFEVPADAEISVRDGRDVSSGAVLFDDVTAPIAGEVTLVENEDGTSEIVIRQAEQWLLPDAGLAVSDAQHIEAGEMLVDNSTFNVYANMDGTVIVADDSVILTPNNIQVIEIPSDAEPVVENEQTVIAGEPLVANDTATVRGTAYVTDDTIYVLPTSAGYTPLRNEYPLGADYLGRDLWSRIVYGARVSLLAAFIGPLVSILVGVPYGLISGYVGGRVDNYMMRFVDLMYAFPTLLLIILLMAFFRSSASLTQPGSFAYQMGEIDRATGGVFFIFLGIGLTSWMQLARLTRGQVLSAREQEYVVAAEALGQSTPQIMTRHILPNVLGPIIISETLSIPTYIRYEAFLSFIGLGVNAPTPSWGNMISDGAAVLRNYPHEALFPALALFIIMFAFNFLGDGLRDALDPRMRGTD